MLVRSVFFLGVVVVGLSQSSWAPVGTVWQYDILGSEPLDKSCYSSVITMEVISDTLIQGKVCRVVKEVHPKTGFERYHYLYEANNRIYYYDSTQWNFILLYDFNVGIDSFWLRGGDTVWVGWIDTLWMFGNPLKRFWVYEDSPVDSAFQNPIVEGLGSWLYFFPVNRYVSGCYDRIAYKGLRCYYEPNGSTWGSCIQVKQQFRQVGAWRVYPTVFEEGVWIESPFKKIGEVRVYDVLGRVVFTSEGDISPLYLPLNSLPKGVYILHTEQGLRTKIVKIQ